MAGEFDTVSRAEFTPLAAVKTAKAGAVIEGMKTALGENWFTQSPEYSGLVRARNAQADVGERLSRLDPDSLAAASVRVSLDAAAAVTAKAKAAIENERRAWATDLIQRASNGEPEARAVLEQLTASKPDAFPKGFALAIANARGDEPAFIGTVAEAILA